MVEKTYCDICGDLIEEDKDSFEKILNVFSDDGDGEVKYDLCNACEQDINNYIKKRIKEHKKERN